METMKSADGCKSSLRSDQLLDLTASSLNNLFSSSSSLQASPVKPSCTASRSSTPLNSDEQQLSELQPLSLTYSDMPGTIDVKKRSRKKLKTF